MPFVRTLDKIQSAQVNSDMWLPKTFSTSDRGIFSALFADDILLTDELEAFSRGDSTYFIDGDPQGRSSRRRWGYMNLRSSGDNFVLSRR